MRRSFTYLGAVYILVIRGDRLLLLRRSNTGFMDGHYGLPSGHLDGGETVREGAARELREEVGVSAAPDRIRVVHVMHRKAAADERFDFFCVADDFEGEPRNCEPQKCDDLVWAPIGGLPANTIGYVREALARYGAGKTYSEHGWGQPAGTVPADRA